MVVKKYLLKIVYTGDSITMGEYVDPSKCWVSIIHDKLTKSLKKYPVQILSINSGVNGATTRIGLELFPENVQRHRPDVVVIQYGFNDCNRWLTDRGLPRVSEMAFKANLIEMVRRSRVFGAKEVIIINMYSTLKGGAYELRRQSYNMAIEEIIFNEPVTRFDISHKFSDRENEFLLQPPDGIHLNENGHKFLADILELSILKKVRRIVYDKITLPGTKTNR
jgi:lysophospholipase L1-like esterase